MFLGNSGSPAPPHGGGAVTSLMTELGKGQACVAECPSISSSRSPHIALSTPRGRGRAVRGAGGHV